MIQWTAAWLLLASAAGAQDGAAPDDALRFAQLIVREQIMVRVPVRARPDRAPPNIEWKEKRGPKCIAARDVRAAAMMGPNSVDLVLRDNSRIRAKLERSCPALDYYHGFYIRPSEDGKVCADRDAIRSRVGGECSIDTFRTLKAVPRDATDD